jgi:hypothetical protein
MTQQQPSITELAEQVSRGQISRGQIDREQGKEVGAAVRLFLHEQSELALSAEPEENEHCERCGKDECDCTLVCECGLELFQTEIEDGETQCEACRLLEMKMYEMIELADQAEAAAIAAGWVCEGWDRARSGSWYAKFNRAGQTIKLRVANHGSLYVTEDISLVIPRGNASGDDHSFATWLEMIA